jgi:hypothetical protein
MTAATVQAYIHTAVPSMEVVRLEASDAETYVSRKFHVVTAGILGVNEDTDSLSPNVVNSDGTTLDGTSKTVKLNLASGSDVVCTLILFGYK